MRKIIKENNELRSMQKNDRRILLSSGIELEQNKIRERIDLAVSDQESIARIIQFFNSHDFYKEFGENNKSDVSALKKEGMNLYEKQGDEDINFRNNAKAMYYFFNNIKDFTTFLEDENNRQILRIITEKELNIYLKSNSINKNDLLELLKKYDEIIKDKIK